MRRLILLRHAKTETDAPSGKDHDRRLDPRGLSDAAAIGSWLVATTLVPDGALVSTATRARQTWDIVAGQFDRPPPVLHLAELYAAGPAQMLGAVRDAGPCSRLLVVGHNPGLHELALSLIEKQDEDGRRALTGNMPTSGLAVIDFPIEDWAAAAFGGGRLSHFVSPKILRAEP